MRCLACNCILSDREASRKYTNWADIPNTEERYIGLCDADLVYTDLNYVENPLANSEKEEEDYGDTGATEEVGNI